MRHNHAMALSFRSGSIVLAVLWIAVGCDSRNDAPGGRAPTVGPLQSDGRIEWQAVLACADCDGIETALVLNQAGEQRDYSLTETFLATDGGDRFVEQGRWQRDGELIRLETAKDGLRVFALLPDGRLEPRDRQGRRFAAREGDVLLPVSMSNGL